MANSRDGRDEDAGVVVIGAGPCAAVAARELVRAGHDVTMLDAGRGAPRGITVHIAGRTALRWVQPGQLSLNRQRSARDPRTEWTSSLSLGGLTNYWTGAVPRFAPEDFTAGAAIDERLEWPIGYDDLNPYYELAEVDLQITKGADLANVPAGRAAHHHRPSSDWEALAAAATQRGDAMAPIPIAKGTRWMVALRAREFTSYHCVVRAFEREPNFRLIRQARVLRINYSAPAGRAESVSYVDGSSGQVRTRRGRAVVLAAGTMDSTEILLRSVSDTFPAGLGNTHGVLGRYLHDHPREWWPARLAKAMTALYHPMYVSREPYGTADPLHAASLTIGLSSGKDRLFTFVNRRIPRVGVQVLGTMIPRDEVGVALHADDRPDDPASQLDIRLTFDDDAIRTVHRARERFRQIFADAGNPAELGPFHDLAPGSSNHLGGTARMHDKPEFGVVDRWNRIHDVPNVVVCDASSFTTGPEKNPTLTAMAIAARAARHLASEV